MNYVRDMIQNHPAASNIGHDALMACIDACFECEQVCTACADACLAEEMVADLRQCIRTDLDCADVCGATGRMLSRQTKPDWDVLRAQVESTVQSAKTCGDECAQHADRHEHCRISMEACRRCEESCRRLLQEVGDTVMA